jgi:hypothetical protein
MSWKLILKACGCGCNDCDSVSKARGQSSQGFRRGNRRTPMRGTTLDSSSYLACIDRLAQRFKKGGMTEREYMQERDRCKEKYGM